MKLRTYGPRPTFFGGRTSNVDKIQKLLKENGGPALPKGARTKTSTPTSNRGTGGKGFKPPTVSKKANINIGARPKIGGVPTTDKKAKIKVGARPTGELPSYKELLERKKVADEVARQKLLTLRDNVSSMLTNGQYDIPKYLVNEIREKLLNANEKDIANILDIMGGFENLKTWYKNSKRGGINRYGYTFRYTQLEKVAEALGIDTKELRRKNTTN